MVIGKIWGPIWNVSIWNTAIWAQDVNPLALINIFVDQAGELRVRQTLF